jgi:hemin uptake protein HemP
MVTADQSSSQTNSAASSSSASPGNSASDSPPESSSGLPTYQFEQLSGESGAVHILLGGVTYVLRKTQAGKLILNK